MAPIPPPQTLLGPELFRFLNLERYCSTQQDWNAPDAAQLWIYNLHYFDDLNARDAAARAGWHEKLVERWIAQNPPGNGAGWESYPVSRRIINWVKWVTRGNALPAAGAASLAVQARWLSQRLEYHILGNHLLANAKALVHAGLYFGGGEADGWYERGCAILERELRAQILPDGGHFELSTMYHAAVLEDLLDLVNLMRAHGRAIPSSWVLAISRMRRWLRIMTHPDGEIAFFNDAAFAVAPTCSELEAYASRLGLPAVRDREAALVVLQASGYARMATGCAYLLCDVAAVGPDHLPGHAHADTLSFELSLGGQRVVVNSGTSEYGAGAERERQRGTAAHNTVVVDGCDSSEVWAGFRVARRARVRCGAVESTAGSSTIEASHDGYDRLVGRNRHWRRWSLEAHAVRIEDRIDARSHSAEAFLHLHPAIQVHRRGSCELQLTWDGNMSARLIFKGAAAVDVRAGTWHPQFGIGVPNYCIIAKLSGLTLTTCIEWLAMPHDRHCTEGVH